MKKMIVLCGLLAAALMIGAPSSANAQSIGIAVGPGGFSFGISSGYYGRGGYGGYYGRGGYYGHERWEHEEHERWEHRGWGGYGGWGGWGGPVYVPAPIPAPIPGPCYDGCGPAYGYHAPIQVVVTVNELVRDRVWDGYCYRWVDRYVPVRRTVTAYWDDYNGGYYYVNAYGQRVYVNY